MKDVGILLARVGIGLSIALAHGLGKIDAYSAHSSGFPDPLGVGNEISMALAIFAELVCGILLVIGLGTRLALTQLIATMSVAIYCHLTIFGDTLFAAPGKSSAELALMYLIPFIALLFTGPGRFSIDHILVKKFANK
ncbi:MAG: DoxX family protein [Lentisphaeraceae bacterium]|nr:DoxX family protein [Lentisphaeraceae bacterium]